MDVDITTETCEGGEEEDGVALEPDADNPLEVGLVEAGLEGAPWLEVDDKLDALELSGAADEIPAETDAAEGLKIAATGTTVEFGLGAGSP